MDLNKFFPDEGQLEINETVLRIFDTEAAAQNYLQNGSARFPSFDSFDVRLLSGHYRFGKSCQAPCLIGVMSGDD